MTDPGPRAAERTLKERTLKTERRPRISPRLQDHRALGEGVHYRACNLCEAICGLEIRVETGVLGDGRITSIRGDEDDPLSRGHICPKGVALQDLHADPDRLRRPLGRNGAGELTEISWDEAFDRVEEGLVRVRREHGPHSVAVYAGNPTVHNYGALLFGPAFARTLGTRRRYSATSVDQLPHHLVARLLYGHFLLLPVPDLDRTEFLLVLGANPVASNGSLMTAPGVERRLKEIRRRGGEVVVVDPRRTETARRADRHLFIRPGSDALWLAALLATIFEEGLEAPGRLQAFTDGIGELARRVAPFTPERVAAATGIPAADTRELARRLAAADRAVVYGRLGVSVHPFGTLCQGLVQALNVVTGNLDRPGGAMFPLPAVDTVARTGRGKRGRFHSRVRGLPEFAGELPVATLAEDILDALGDGVEDGGPEGGSGKGAGHRAGSLSGDWGPIRALVVSAGNPVLSTPDGRRLERALAALDFVVALDPYLTETSRLADVVLPSTSPLQRDHYDLAFHGLAVRNTARYSPALYEPGPGELHDWQIFAELERRLGPGGLAARLGRWVRRRLGPRGLLDLALRTGPWGAGFLPWRSGLTLGRLEKQPHGVDLGPLQPCLPDRLAHRDRRIRLLPDELAAELDRLEGELRVSGGPAASPDGELLLIGRRQVRSNNSWMHNVPRLMKGRDRCTLLMHPQDARRLGFGGNGEQCPRARIISRVGRVEVPVEITEEIMPGVVSLPHGWGHDRPGVGWSLAAENPGASFNDLTDARRVDPASGNAVLNGLPVRVEPAC